MNLFGFKVREKADPDDRYREEGEQRIMEGYVFPWQRGVPLKQDANFNQLVNSLTGWVYVCASINSNTVAKIPLKLYVQRTPQNATKKLLVQTKQVDNATFKRLKANESLKLYTSRAISIDEVLDHPWLDLLVRPNPLFNRFTMWETTELFQEVTGNAYWYIVTNNLGTPVALWPVPSQQMKIVLGKQNIISGYVYDNGLYKVPFDYEEIVHFRFPSLKSMFYGMAPLTAVLDAHQFNLNVKTYENALLENMARPEGVLSTEEFLSDPEFERLRLRWQSQGGASKVGKVRILEKGLKYTPMSWTTREMNYVKGREITREEICGAYGIPISKVTANNVNRANAEAGESQYMTDAIEPRLRRIEEKINERIMPMYDPTLNLFVAYDNPVPADKAYRLTEIQSHLSTGYSDINEERRIDGKEEVPWGDGPFLSPMLSKYVPNAVNEDTTVEDLLPEPKKKPENNVDVEEEDEEEKMMRLAEKIAKLVKKKLYKKGGAGSGHFGHAGRPGEVGGSTPGEGGGSTETTPNVVVDTSKLSKPLKDYGLRESDLKSTFDVIGDESKLTISDDDEKVYIDCKWKSKGEDAGTFEGSYNKQTKAFYLSLFRLDESVQDKGSAKDILNTVESELAHKFGAEKSELYADISIGTYAWAREGYDFKSDKERNRAIAKFKRWTSSTLGALYYDDKISEEEYKSLSKEISSKMKEVKTAGDIATFNTGGLVYSKEEWGITNDDVKNKTKMHLGKAFMLDTSLGLGSSGWQGVKKLKE